MGSEGRNYGTDLDKAAMAAESTQLHSSLCSTFCEGQSGSRLDGPDALSLTSALGSLLSNIHRTAVCGDS